MTLDTDGVAILQFAVGDRHTGDVKIVEIVRHRANFLFCHVACSALAASAGTLLSSDLWRRQGTAS